MSPTPVKNITIAWEISKPVQPPVVKAGVQFSYELGQIDLISKTNINSNLTVRENSFLILLCVAAYPVLWYQNGKKAANQTDFKQSPSYRPKETFDQWASSHEIDIDQDYYSKNKSGNYWITGFESILKIEGITSDAAGIYTCMESSNQFTNLKTEINVIVKPRLTAKAMTQKPQLIQASFDEVGTSYDLYPGFSCYYSITPDMPTTEYFVLPTNEKMEPGDDIDGMTLTIRNITPVLRQAMFFMPSRSRDDFYEGEYKFEVELQDGDKKRSVHIHTFKYTLQRYTGDRVREVTGHIPRTDVTMGELFELHAYQESFFLMTNAAFGVFTNDDVAVPVDEYAKRCGVIGVARIYDYNVGPTWGRIQVVINSSKPCFIVLEMMNERRKTKYLSYLDITPRNK